MASAGLLSTGTQSCASSASVTDLLSRPAPVAEPERSQSDRLYGSTVSMSGIDVWGNMALGDTQISTNTYSNEAALSGNGSAAESFSFTQPHGHATEIRQLIYLIYDQLAYFNYILGPDSTVADALSRVRPAYDELPP
jgi:hypothetical protein